MLHFFFTLIEHFFQWKKIGSKLFFNARFNDFNASFINYAFKLRLLNYNNYYIHFEKYCLIPFKLKGIRSQWLFLFWFWRTRKSLDNHNQKENCQYNLIAFNFKGIKKCTSLSIYAVSVYKIFFVAKTKRIIFNTIIHKYFFDLFQIYCRQIVFIQFFNAIFCI